MEGWKKENPNDWDAPTKEAGGRYTVWEAMLELEPCKTEAGTKHRGAATMLIDS